MEFTNEIFFNKPLSAESTVIITYCGKLYREHSKDISIVYGYGDNWAETDNSPMLETENGFEVTLTIKDYNTFNFCFTNSFNIWDNNSGFNYIAPIGPKQDGNKIENSQTEYSVSAEGTEEDNTEQTEENQVEEQAESETTENFEDTKPQDDVEAVFASLLDSILDDTNSNDDPIDISNLSGFGLQSIDEIKEEDIVNCDEIFAELFKEFTLEDDTNDITQVENKLDLNSEQESTTIREFSNVDYEKYDAQELDNLMDNLLASISEKNETEDYATPVQKIESNEFENSNLPATIVEKEDWVDKIINVSYSIGKKVSTAFKKFGKLVKLKAKELGILNNDNK